MIYFLLSALKYLICFIILVTVFGYITNYTLRAKGYSGPVSDHFNGKQFYNIGSTPGVEDSIEENVNSIEEADNEPQPRSMISWLLNRSKNKWIEKDVATTVPEKRIEGDKLVVTYINHSTVLIQTQGLNILTDPIWSKRASPLSWVGPSRYQNPGVKFDDLPQIDIVILSHNHYDHMDIPTLKHLSEKFSPKVFAPLGNADYLSSRGIKDVVDMDWFDKEKISDLLTLAMVPAQHFSSRGLSDRNNTLWAGYVLEVNSGNIYFAGDTGFGPWVQKLTDAYPNGFRLALIPIGAFKPRSFMKEVHISPTEALNIKDKIKAKEAIAIHFGTFKLADDKQDEPANEITNSSDGSFIAIPNGGTFEAK